MASKETHELIMEALNHYISFLMPENTCPSIETMRKLVKLDDIKKGLEKKGDDE